jgi:hypothetical protein
MDKEVEINVGYGLSEGTHLIPFFFCYSALICLHIRRRLHYQNHSRLLHHHPKVEAMVGFYLGEISWSL